MKYKLKLKSKGKTNNEPIKNNFSTPYHSNYITKLSSTSRSNLFETKSKK